MPMNLVSNTRLESEAQVSDMILVAGLQRMNKILLIEDQTEFQVIVRQIIEDASTHLVTASSVAEAKEILQSQTFNMILLDISLPDQSGLEFFANLQTTLAKETPIIFLTGNDGYASKITAFSLGAEDYITKPFHPLEFKARVHAKLKKSSSSQGSAEEIKFGPFHFKLGAQRVFNLENGAELELTPKEFKILYYMARNEDRVLSRDNILNEVWGSKTNVTDRTIDTNIYLLRKKLGALADHIESVPSVGYRFRLKLPSKKVA